ncbi:MAG: hypothetical protein NDI94_05695, partial [Candidatus Woesearchaeota archaeon]|nr:hypothetical protein [Candidatus Woesearchaeota archaeon]
MDFEFRIRTRVTHVDKSLLMDLKKTGCSTVSYGVESGEQAILDKMQKDTTLSRIESAFSSTEKEGINILGFFMIGNKGETKSTIYKTIAFAKKLNPMYATFGVLHPYPGTYDYESSKKNGTLQGDYAPYKPLPWIKLDWTEDVSELYAFSDKAYKEFYWRPAYMKKFAYTVLKDKNLNLLGYSLKHALTNISRLNGI